MVLINTRIFFRGSKLCGESITSQGILVSKKNIGGNHAFGKERHTLLCVLKLFTNIVD